MPEQHSQYLLQLSHNFKPVWAPTKLFGATLIVFLKCISQSVFYFNYTFSGARGRASIESPRQHSQYCLQLSHDFKPIWVPTKMFGATLIVFLKCISQSVCYLQLHLFGRSWSGQHRITKETFSIFLTTVPRFQTHLGSNENVWRNINSFFSNLLVNPFFIFNYTFSGAGGRASKESPKQHSQYFSQLSRGRSSSPRSRQESHDKHYSLHIIDQKGPTKTKTPLSSLSARPFPNPYPPNPYPHIPSRARNAHTALKRHAIVNQISEASVPL